MAQAAEKIPVRDQEFSRKILREANTHLGRCYQCCACSDACPMADAMDYYPHQLIHMVRLGLKDKVLQSRTIWICVSCWACAIRCPNEIDIVRFMDILRMESLKEGLKGPIDTIPQFHRIFLEEIRRRGRISELGLLFRYRLKAGGFFPLKRLVEDVTLGLKMFFKGKLRPGLPIVTGKKAVEEMFERAGWSKGRQ